MKKKYYLFEMKPDLLNIYSIILMGILGLLLFLIYRENTINNLSNGWDLTFLLMIPYFILHEIFHSLAYCLHGASFKNITYGAHIEKGILCCLCKQNITKKNILISLLYPFFFLGIVTLIIGLIFNIYPLVVLSVLNISGCTGDFIMFYDLVKLKDFEFSEFDNPIAFALYSKEDLSKVNLIGLKYLGNTDKLERNDLKKIRISNLSIICFLIITMLGIINLFL